MNGTTTAHVTKANLDGTGITTVADYAAPATSSYGEGGITTDGTNVYWASQKSGVFHAALTDGACTENSTCAAYGGADGPFGIAVDAQFVYWTEPAQGNVKRALKTGGVSTNIASRPGQPKAIAVLGTNVYWSNTGTTALGASIRRAPQVAAQCVADGCELVASVPSIDAIVAADDGIYWTDDSATGGVYRLAK